MDFCSEPVPEVLRAGLSSGPLFHVLGLDHKLSNQVKTVFGKLLLLPVLQEALLWTCQAA